MNKTVQREAILSELRKMCTHPTADELYAVLRPKVPQISLGTIYRNLEDMALRCEAAGILPILATVHRCDLCQPWDNGKSDRILTAENGFLREFAARHGWPLLDWAACFERDGEKRIREYAVDGVHPDWNGYVLMRDALVACLRACGILKE